MNILICGGNGFIGKYLVSHFSTSEMFNVRSTYYNTVPNKLPNVDYVQADLRNSQEVKNVLKNIDIVFQYAATSTGANDLFVIKYNSSGTRQWTKQLGSASTDAANGVATDSSGNVYVAGVTYGGLDGKSILNTSDYDKK